MVRIHLLLPLLLGAVLAACGPDETPSPTPALGPPLIEHAPRAGAGSAVLLQARAPCRVRLVAEGFPAEGERRVLLRSDVPAGRTLPLHWDLIVSEAAPEEGLRPPPEMESEGRTQAWRVVARGLLGERGGLMSDAVVWTRPGLGRTHHPTPPAPAIAEALPFGSTWELDLLVVADVAGGRVRFTTPEGLTLARVEDRKEGDRLRIFRLLLVVEKS